MFQLSLTWKYVAIWWSHLNIFSFSLRFYSVVMIAIYISTCFSYPPDKGIPTDFLNAPQFSARGDILGLSSWIDPNWKSGKTLWLEKIGGWIGGWVGEQTFSRGKRPPKDTIHLYYLYFTCTPNSLPSSYLDFLSHLL